MTLDRRSRWWIAGGAVFVLSVAIAGIWREIDRDVGDTVFVPGFDVQLTDADRPATAVLVGSDWVLERPPGIPCVRLRIGDRATECLSFEFDDGSSAHGVVRGSGGRTFIQLFGGPSLGQVKVFTSAGDELITPVVPDIPGAGAIAIAELAPGEEPYGIQAFDQDGLLLFVLSLVDSLG